MDIEVLIHSYFYKDVQTQVSPVTVVPGKPPGVSEVRGLSPVPQLGTGDLHGKLPLF